MTVLDVVLCRELVAKRQEAQALVGEMECTAQAFEEVQEQNLRLLQQIKEKDDANFKVPSAGALATWP